MIQIIILRLFCCIMTRPQIQQTILHLLLYLFFLITRIKHIMQLTVI